MFIYSKQRLTKKVEKLILIFFYTACRRNNREIPLIITYQYIRAYVNLLSNARTYTRTNLQEVYYIHCINIFLYINILLHRYCIYCFLAERKKFLKV